MPLANRGSAAGSAFYETLSDAIAPAAQLRDGAEISTLESRICTQRPTDLDGKSLQLKPGRLLADQPGHCQHRRATAKGRARVGYRTETFLFKHVQVDYPRNGVDSLWIKSSFATIRQLARGRKIPLLQFEGAMGAIRLFLAFVVVIGHLEVTVLEGAHIPFPGYYQLGLNAGFAVMFFYIVSGFLISTALAHKYPATSEGNIAFYKSRFIRIFSLYWPIALIVIMVWPSAFLSHSIKDKLTNIFIFGIDWRLNFADYPAFHSDATLTFLKPAWSLGAELTFYALAPIILRSHTLTLVIFILSAVTRAALVYSFGFDTRWTYLFLPSTFLFFLIGHLAQTFSLRFPTLKSPALGLTFLGLMLPFLLSRDYATWDSFRFWSATFFFAAALPGIFAASKDSRWLNALGDLSYPVYLVHFLLIGIAIKVGLFTALPKSALIIIPASLLISLGAAGAAHWALEIPTAFAMRRLAETLPRFVRIGASMTHSRAHGLTPSNRQLEISWLELTRRKIR